MTEPETQQLDTLLHSVQTLEPLIRAHAEEAERNRHLSQPVVAALKKAGVFHMYIPKALN